MSCELEQRTPEQLGLGLSRDAEDAQARFTYACGTAPTFAACNAVAGYLSVAWLGRAKRSTLCRM